MSIQQSNTTVENFAPSVNHTASVTRCRTCQAFLSDGDCPRCNDA